jgi:hypothetical protein
MSINIVVSLVLNDLFKMFNPIEEDRLDVFEYRVFSDLCHGFQPSETIRPLSCARAFHRTIGCRCSDIVNQVSGEGIQVLHRSFVRSFYTQWNCLCEWKMIPINIHGKIASSRRGNYVKCHRWNSPGCILIRWQCAKGDQTLRWANVTFHISVVTFPLGVILFHSFASLWPERCRHRNHNSTLVKILSK